MVELERNSGGSGLYQNTAEDQGGLAEMAVPPETSNPISPVEGTRTGDAASGSATDGSFRQGQYSPV